MKLSKKLFVSVASLLMLVGCNNELSSSVEESSSVADSPSEELSSGPRYVIFENEANGDYYEGFANEENVPNGYGVMYYANGDMYEGNFEDGKKSGTGTMTFDTGCIYIGEWEENMMQGTGYMRWPMGDYFHGTWKNGNPSYGTKYFLQPDAPFDGTIEQRFCIYHGEFDEAGFLSGYGTMRWPAGDFYVGQFANNQRSGYGTLYWPSNDQNIPEYSFVGEFSSDHGGFIYGEGTMYYRDGRVVTGTWDGTTKVE